MTFTTDIDNLIRMRVGDVNRLRNIKDTIRHDNFITTVDKEYVESLISKHIKKQTLDELEINVKPKTYTKSEVNVEPTSTETVSSSSSLFSGSNNKKLGILVGVAAVIALVVVVGFSGVLVGQTGDYDIKSTLSQKLTLDIDESSYKNADIISVSGNAKVSDGKSLTLLIENTTGELIWKEYISTKGNGNFSTLVLAGGYGWDSTGTYTLKAQYNDLENKIEFGFTV